jgi:AAA domain
VRKYGDNCYLLTGKAGTGKTTLLTAMYGHALMKWALQTFKKEKLRGIEAVWKVNANVLAKQQRDWAMRNEGRDAETGQPAILPTVTKNKVLEAVRVGLVPHLFLDEFDKIKLDSAFQLNEFSEIIDAIQSNGGQVVACTNMSVLALRFALGAQHGDAIVRRLIGPRMNEKRSDIVADPTVGGFHVDCDAGTFTQEYRLPSITVPAQPKVIESEAGLAEVKEGYNLKTANANPGVSQTTSAPSTPTPPPPAESRPGNAKGAFEFDGSVRHRKP